MKRYIALLLSVITIFGSTVLSAAAADDFAAVLAAFPDSYKASLTALHKAHPNWEFKRVSVGKNFATCLNAEHDCRKQECTVLVSSAKDSRACQADCPNAKYHAISDGTRCASYDYIAECMDPTNFLKENLIFQFEYLNAKSFYTRDKLEKALEAAYSFMYKKTCTVSGKSYYYSQIILDACKANNVDALFIISRITNEVGALYPVKLAKGYPYKGKTVYNFFSIGAYPTANATAPENGAKYAYNHGWTNPKAALEGGIKFIAQNYIKKGQYTNYFQKYQVNPGSPYGFYEHQYMQGVDAIINESGYTYKHYTTLGVLESKHVFYLPVYENLSKVDYEAQDLKFKNAAESTDYVFVNAQVSSELALRSGAGTSYSKKAGIKRGVLLQYNGRSGAWFKVKVLNGAQRGNTGYVHSDYVNFAQKLTVQKGATLVLKPKLRTSTCSYALASETVNAAVTVKSGVASGNQIGSSVFQAKTDSGSIGYVELACAGRIDAPKFTLSSGDKRIGISWSAVPGAQAYRVYSYNTASKQYARIAETTKTSYTVTGLAANAQYTFLVRAFDIAGGGSAYTEKSNLSAYTLPEKPQYAITATTASATLSWKAAKGAEKYGIWQYNPSSDSYTKLANTTALSYLVPGLKANTKYTFLVRSYNAKSGWSAFTRADNEAVITAPKPPVVTAKGGENAIRLTWNACTGASFYRVYSYNASTKTYKRIAQTEALTYKITGLAAGTEYTYLVRAFRSNASGSRYGTANHVAAGTIPAKPTVKATALSGDKVQLEWNIIKGAEHYGVWLYNSKSGSYTKLANVNALSYTVENLQPNTRYAFLVRAHNATGWNKYTVKDNITVKTK